MLKILAIAPYQNLKTKIDEIAENFKTLYVESYVGDLSVGLAIAQKKASKFDVVISRGGTAKLLAKYIVAVELGHHIFDPCSKFIANLIGLTLEFSQN